MKKITLALLIMLAFCWQSNAQFTESFEAGIPATWSVINGGDANTWEVSTPGDGGTANTGTNVARIYFSAAAHDDYLVTQQFTVTANTSERLTLAYRHRSNTFPEPFDILLSTTTATAADFTNTIATAVAPSTTWQSMSYDLSAYIGQTVYIAFYSSTTDQWQLYLDDITIDALPTCSAPAGTAVLGTVDCGAGTFEVNIDITDLGDGTPALFDGTTTTPITTTGSFTVGPFPAGTPLTFTLQHGSDTQCDVDLGTLQDTCPPVEDNCMGAITIPVSADMCTSITTGNNTNSTDSDTDVPAPPAATCTSYAGGDIWFNLTVPASGNVTISGDVSSDCCSFLWYEIYEGTDCSSLTSVICSVSTGNDPSAFETILTGRTGGETLWVRAWDSNYDDGPGDFNFCAYEPACFAPTVSLPAGPIDNTNCPATVDVSISIDDLGDSASLTISAEDDMGNPVGTGGTISATGIFTITNVPVPQTSWTITIAHEDNTTCDVQLGPFILDCPPVNDDCVNAVALTPGGVFGDNPVDGKIAYATESGYTNGCGGNPSSEVWYSVVVPAAGDITIEVGPDTATSNTGFDSVIEAYTSSDNTCSGTLTSIGCDDDGATTGSFSILALTGLTAGDTVFVRVWEFNSDDTEPFSISAYSATLGVDSIDSEAAFTYYPNPVKNTLTLNAQNTIETITIYNMLGQEVLRATPNAVDSDIDMFSLQTGTYFVKVTIANITKTIRVIKQ